MKISVYLKDREKPLYLDNTLAVRFVEEFTTERKDWISIQNDNSSPDFAFIRREDVTLVISRT